MRIHAKVVRSLLLFALVGILECNGEPPPSSYGAPPKDRPSPAYGPPPNGGHGAPAGLGSRPGGASPSSNYGPPPSPDIRPPSSGGGGGVGGFGKSSPAAGGGFPDSSSDSGSEDAKPEPFSFMYEVKDAATGNDFSHKQESDGKTVRGEYKVLLPDGRNQVVTYTADDGGYNADVKYDGEAQTPSGDGVKAAGGNAAAGGAGGYPSGGPAGYPSGGPGAFPSAGSSGYPAAGPPKNKPALELPPKSSNGGGSSPGHGGGGGASSFNGYPSGSPTGATGGSPQNSYLPPSFSGY